MSKYKYILFDLDGTIIVSSEGIAALYGFGAREELEATGARYIVKDVNELKNILID